MSKPPSQALFDMFEEKMSQVCSVVPSGHAKTIVSDEWFGYLDSLRPAVECIRPTELFRSRQVVVRKTGNLPVLSFLMERINEDGFDGIIIEDPGISTHHNPTWGPNLLLVGRDFADKALMLGSLP